MWDVLGVYCIEIVWSLKLLSFQTLQQKSGPENKF